MPGELSSAFALKLSSLDASTMRFVVELVNLVLTEARRAGASDVHLLPTGDGLDVRWRIDGVLHLVASLPAAIAPNAVARLKVMADLLTYRTDVPQEGRIRGPVGEPEMRVSTFPTLHGEKAVVRLFAESGRYLLLDDLGLPAEIRGSLGRLLAETSGAIILTGPAGSGKTTTLYACLRELTLTSEGRRSLATLEDPIESALAGVAQSQVNPVAGFDLASGLRSLMRQDPEVIGVGEIRDAITAGLAFQASLTGHLVLTTYHAGSAAGAVGRLSDMGIEPYLLRSGLLAVVSQRLVRALCSCARESTRPDEFLGLPLRRARVGVGCDACRGTGYRGRTILAEILIPQKGDVGREILDRTDVARVEEAAVRAGMVTRWTRACQAVEDGTTSPAEIRRTLGLSADPGPDAL